MPILQRLRGAVGRLWRWASNVEQLVAFWERIPRLGRRAIHAVVRRWIEVVVGVLWVAGNAILQVVGSIPPWIVWWTAWFSALVGVLLFERIALARARRRLLDERLSARLARRERSRQQEAAAKDRIAAAEKIIPRLPPDLFKPLTRLLVEPQYLERRAANVFLNHGFVRTLTTIPPRDYFAPGGREPEKLLCELNEEIRGLVDRQWTIRRNEEVQQVTEDKDSRCRDALRFFSVSEDHPLPWPEPLSKGTWDLWNAFWALCGREILTVEEEEDADVFSVASQFKATVESVALGGAAIQRRSIRFPYATVPDYDAEGEG